MMGMLKKHETRAFAARALYWLALLAPLLLLMPGCDGCQADDPATAAKKKKEKEVEEKKKKRGKTQGSFRICPLRRRAG